MSVLKKRKQRAKTSKQIPKEETILKYVKIKKEITNNDPSRAILPDIFEPNRLDSNQNTNKDKTKRYGFDTTKWQKSNQFKNMRELNRHVKIFLIERFGQNDYDTKLIQDLESNDSDFMTRLRASFETRGVETLPIESIWTKVKHSNKARIYTKTKINNKKLKK